MFKLRPSKALFTHTAISTLALSLVWASPALAQQAGIQIAVVGENGESVGNAVVIIENRAIGLKQTLRTDRNGLARLEGLTTAGSYDISVEQPNGGLFPEKGSVELRANYTSSITLRVSQARGETVVVTGLRQVTSLNNVNAEISASLNQTQLADLPIEGRDVIGALIRLPNVVPSTGFFPEAPQISINGANGLDTNYLIDGLDNNENFLGGIKFPVPLGFTRNVTVLANSYPVSYGRTANGIVNYTTPSGGNTLSGEVYALVRPGRPLDAKSPFPRRDFGGNAVGDSFRRYQGGVALGGPITQDKTFFYVNYEYTQDRNVQIVDAPSLGIIDRVTGDNRFHLGSVRIDHRLNDQWTLGFRANIGRVAIDRPGGSLGGGNATFPSAGSEQERHATLLAATATRSGSTWSYDGAVQFGRFRWDYANPKGSAGPQVTIRDTTGLTAGVVGHPGYVFNDLEETWQITQKLQRAIGDHRISLGADLIRSDFSLLGGGNPDGNYTVDLTSAQLGRLTSKGLGLTARDVLDLNPAVANYSVELRPQSFGTDQSLIAIYVEDQWQVSPSLTATLGLRWDYDSLTARGGTDGDYDNFAPRFALNWRPDARSSVRFGAGVFTGKLSYAVISDALQRNSKSSGLLSQLNRLKSLGIISSEVDLSKLTFDGNLTVSPTCATVAACPTPEQVQALRQTATLGEARILNPAGYESPYSVQYSSGYQYQATSSLTLSVDALYSESRNLVRLRDLNAPAPFSPNLANLTDANIARLRAAPDNAARLALAQSLGLVRSQAAADATRPVALVAGGARQITVSETSGKSEYIALILQANKARGSDDYAFRATYTLSRLNNDTDDINFRAANSNDFSTEWGPSANDRRHVISLVGYYYPAKDLTLSLAGLFQSGQPINPVPDARIFGTQDLNGDGASFGENYVGNSDRYPGARRNSKRLPWSSTIDFGLRYQVPTIQGLEVSLDIFNILNANNKSGFANAATTSNQVQFGGDGVFIQRNAGPPRQFQFGTAWKF